MNSLIQVATKLLWLFFCTDMKIELFFATNRNHQGKNQWNPKKYGKKFSSNGSTNLRFGKLSINADKSKIDAFLTKTIHGDVGDGEGLSGYFTKLVKDADIRAYQDNTPDATDFIPQQKNASYRFFNDLKKQVMSVSDVMIYIHGYNVDWFESAGAALALEYMLNSKKDGNNENIRIILFSWPSNGSMMPYAAYRSDRGDARNSGEAVGRAMLKLKDYLTEIWKLEKQNKDQLCKKQIHLACHSMGNYVLQNALGKLIEHAHGPALPRLFDHIFMFAPDVDSTVFEKNKPMHRLPEMCRNVQVYYNKQDLGMLISDTTKGHIDRLGQIGNAIPGEMHKKIHQIDCTPSVKGLVEHSYYLWGRINLDIRHCIDDIPDHNNARVRKPENAGAAREWVIS